MYACTYVSRVPFVEGVGFNGAKKQTTITILAHVLLVFRRYVYRLSTCVYVGALVVKQSTGAYLVLHGYHGRPKASYTRRRDG